ncbi:pre-mRNA-splicing regulator WTAP-like isoform X2 [Hetaerina americana]|uniref:pre-mRNA-splicing regulator WTAP-like isoform X2 n=1 Tax=Hetaerina americana TaxID=62018 RepID=UPI003A7F441D
MSEESLVSTPMICSNGHQRRVKLTDQQFEKMTREEVRNNWHEQDLYIDILESQIASQEGEIASLRESEERMRQQHLESTHREKVLVRRLATKEQEMQEYASQIAEFKAGQTAGSSALRSALLDPAVNLLMQSLRNELVATKTRLEETQNELSAWKFTPDSNTGKRLMAKCRLLYQENEELGRMISSGRLAKLEGELALQKRFSDEVKKSQSELDEFLQELDEDVDGMQSTIYYLQQELKKSKEAYMNLQKQINSQVTEAPAGSVDTNKSVNIKELDEFLQDLNERMYAMQNSIGNIQQKLKKSNEDETNLPQQKSIQISETTVEYMDTNAQSSIKDSPMSSPDEVKSGPEYSCKTPSPLLRVRPISRTMNVNLGNTIGNGNKKEIIRKAQDLELLPYYQIKEIGGKIDPEEEKTDSAEGAGDNAQQRSPKKPLKLKITKRWRLKKRPRSRSHTGN